MDLFYGIPLEKLIFLACWIALAILGGALLAFGWEWLQAREDEDRHTNRGNGVDRQSGTQKSGCLSGPGLARRALEQSISWARSLICAGPPWAR